MPEMRKDIDYRSVYNPDDVNHLLKYAKTMEKHTIGEICLENDIIACDNKKDKGRLGQVIEYGFFFIERNSNPEPDLGNGIELKTTPIRINKDGSMYPKERLSLSMINYDMIYNGMNFEEALHHKLDTLLIIFYRFQKDKMDLKDQFIEKVVLWSMPEEDLKIIRDDWNIIKNLITSGHADKLSGRLTNYLEPAPKGKNKCDLVSYGNGLWAKKRGFALKACYVNRIFNSEQPMGHIPSDFSKGFDRAILERFEQYYNLKTSEIESQLGIHVGTSKQMLAILANYMICGHNSKKIDELEKAGIMMKTVRVENGRPVWPMTFPAFDYYEIAENDWEDSVFRSILDRKILLVIFDVCGDTIIFRKASLWMVPESDLEEIADTWNDTKKHIKDGSYIFLTHQKDAKIAFVKPHSTKETKQILCPDGQYRSRLGFALKQDYIKKIIEEL